MEKIKIRSFYVLQLDISSGRNLCLDCIFLDQAFVDDAHTGALDMVGGRDASGDHRRCFWVLFAELARTFLLKCGEDDELERPVLPHCRKPGHMALLSGYVATIATNIIFI